MSNSNAAITAAPGSVVGTSAPAGPSSTRSPARSPVAIDQPHAEPELAPVSADKTAQEQGSDSSKRIVTHQNKPKAEDVSSNRFALIWSWCTSRDLYLENTGSVARDHLANERSYLAWLRTSTTLASIGIIIAQLFRLSSSLFTLPDDFPSASSPSSPSSTDIPNTEDLPQLVANLLAASQQQNEILNILLTAQESERHRYKQLGKPIGACFLMISVLFVLLGTYRYVSVQHFLTSKNYFPPARRSILISAIAILALSCVTFSLLFVLR